MSQYKIGSVTLTNGSADMVGVGTSWLANISTGDYFVRVGDNVSYEVGSVNSDTSITLTANYAGVTGSALSYVAHKDFHPNGAPKWSNADVEFAAIQNRWNAQSQPVSAYGTAAFSDIIGTVSESSGVPTGAIIESYASGGTYVIKYADGTMLMTFSEVVGNTSFGSSSTLAWTYPEQFIAVPIVSPSVVSLLPNDKVFVPNASAPSVSSVNIKLYFLAPNGESTCTANATAIGRWF